MIHESKDGLAGNGCADSRTQAAQHMGLHQTALAALPVVPAACRGADAGVQVRSHGRCADRIPEVQSLQGHLGQRVGRLQKLYPLHVLAGLPALSDQHPEAEVYGLLWGFPIPILLAFLLNRIESKKIKQKVQLVLYMPNFISVIVLCGIVRVLLSVTGPVNGLLHTSINFMTLPEAFRPIYIISGIWQGAGWASIMYTASLSNASKDLKEAAMIDGANLIQQIMTVEWPAIKDMVVIQFILQAGNIMSIGFEKAYALQTDLNLNTAEIIATYVYKKGLLDGDYSFSTAVGLFNTVVNVILLIAVNKVVAKMNDGKGL